MPASGWTLSPAVTHIFLTHTLEQKSPLFILRCMRSFCDTEHNPFFYYFDRLQRHVVIPVWFSNCLCIRAALQLCVSGVLHDFTLTFCTRVTHMNIYWHHSPKKFWKNHPCSLKFSLSMLPVAFAPFAPYSMGTPSAVSASSGNFQCVIRGEMQKEEGRFAIFPTSAASALKWNEATRHHW